MVSFTGWQEALVLMKPGSKWELFIPPNLAYDVNSPPAIPPGSHAQVRSGADQGAADAESRTGPPPRRQVPNSPGNSHAARPVLRPSSRDWAGAQTARLAAFSPGMKRMRLGDAHACQLPQQPIRQIL